MKGHVVAFLGGFLLDMALGDPHWLPHPISLIGRLISLLERRLNSWGKEGKGKEEKQKEIFRGLLLVILVTGITASTAGLLLSLAYGLHPWLGILVETLMTYQILAAKCLREESMKVCQRLEEGRLKEARSAVAMIVGRDTEQLDEKGIVRAAVETVAENTSDGVIAPLLYTALGGPVLGFFYKAVNTMDSMVGYKNEKYLYFGRFAAKLDDIVNYIPARLAALLMIASAKISGLDGKMAWKIWNRDRRNHASPNSAQTESAAAGALHVQLAGNAYYFGKLYKKPFIGDDLRSIERADIVRINRLMVTSSVVSLLLMGLVKLLVLVFV